MPRGCGSAPSTAQMTGINNLYRRDRECRGESHCVTISILFLLIEIQLEDTPLHTIELLPTQASLWDYLQPMLLENRIPQALLFVGPAHSQKLQFVNRFIAAYICQENDTAPCGCCKACHLLLQGTHPDICYIGQEANEKGIKIDHIRNLQLDAYQTPKHAQKRFQIIDPADKLNLNAANALLKILEEPPLHTVFILLAEQVSSILPTILSRCQRYYLKTPPVADYLLLGEQYGENTPRRELFTQSPLLISKLCDLIEKKISPCSLAVEWGKYSLEDLLWLLYLLTAQALHYSLLNTRANFPWTEPLKCFSALIPPFFLCKQLDKIDTLTRKINHNINMNTTLAIEDLLLGYLGHTHD